MSAIIEAKQITQSLCQIIENNKDLWNSSKAAKITKPKFYITFQMTVIIFTPIEQQQLNLM